MEGSETWEAELTNLVVMTVRSILRRTGRRRHEDLAPLGRPLGHGRFHKAHIHLLPGSYTSTRHQI